MSKKNDGEIRFPNQRELTELFVSHGRAPEEAARLARKIHRDRDKPNSRVTAGLTDPELNGFLQLLGFDLKELERDSEAINRILEAGRPRQEFKH